MNGQGSICIHRQSETAIVEIELREIPPAKGAANAPREIDRRPATQHAANAIYGF
jgi:hypothetical protein